MKDFFTMLINLTTGAIVISVLPELENTTKQDLMLSWGIGAIIGFAFVKYLEKSGADKNE